MRITSMLVQATASASFAGDGNHLGNSGSTTFDIDQAPSTMTVTCPAGPYVYTGRRRAVLGERHGAGGLNDTPTASYANNTNAGTATASYTFAGDTNHDGSGDAENFTINPASSTTGHVHGRPVCLHRVGANAVLGERRPAPARLN